MTLETPKNRQYVSIRLVIYFYIYYTDRSPTLLCRWAPTRMLQVLIAASPTTHMLLNQRVVTMKYNSLRVDFNAQLSVHRFMGQDPEAAINNMLYNLCSSFNLLRQNFLNWLLNHFLGKIFNTFFDWYKNLVEVFFSRWWLWTLWPVSVGVEFEGAFNGCPISHVIPVTLECVETVRFCARWLLLWCCCEYVMELNQMQSNLVNFSLGCSISSHESTRITI